MGYLFLLCLLLPVYTITGYDASAHTSEETKNAAHSVPRGIVSRCSGRRSSAGS
jgi:amino acid transporter